MEALNHDMEKGNDCRVNEKKTRVTETPLLFSLRITTIFDFSVFLVLLRSSQCKANFPLTDIINQIFSNMQMDLYKKTEVGKN